MGRRRGHRQGEGGGPRESVNILVRLEPGQETVPLLPSPSVALSLLAPPACVGSATATETPNCGSMRANINRWAPSNQNFDSNQIF